MCFVDLNQEFATRVKNVLEPLYDLLGSLVEQYMDFHRNPELSGAEVRTADRVVDELRRAGYDVVDGIGGYGVVGILRNGDGPVVMLRADMDGLPVAEETRLPYASTRTATDETGSSVPVSHACGHDAHLTCLLGSATLLANARHDWSGTLLVLAQPAEESANGAVAMLRDGVYERAGTPDVALAQHAVPLPAGAIGHREGPIMAASAVVHVTIFGTGGHSSVPHAGTDPVVIAAHVITRLQTIVSREIDPNEFAVVSVGTVQAAGRPNIIPDRVELGISVRSYGDEVQDHLIEAIRRIVYAEVDAADGDRKPEIVVAESVPVNSNSPAHSRLVRASHERFFGDGRVVDAPRLAAGEDFPYFGVAGSGTYYDGSAVPTVYWLLGSTDLDVWQAAPGDTPEAKLTSLPINHSPNYAPAPRPTIQMGVQALVAGALAFLQNPEP